MRSDFSGRISPSAFSASDVGGEPCPLASSRKLEKLGKSDTLTCAPRDLCDLTDRVWVTGICV